MAYNFYPWINNEYSETNVLSGSDFLNDSQRQEGFKAGTVSSAIRVNSGLRQSNLVAVALMKVASGSALSPSNPFPANLDLTSKVDDVAQVLKTNLIGKMSTEFSRSESRSNIQTNETVQTIFGKIEKYFYDMKSFVFEDLQTAQSSALLPPTTNLLTKSSYARVYRSLSDINSSLTNSSTLIEICDAIKSNNAYPCIAILDATSVESLRPTNNAGITIIYGISNGLYIYYKSIIDDAIYYTEYTTALFSWKQFATTNQTYSKMYPSISQVSALLTNASTILNVYNYMFTNSYLMCMNDGYTDTSLRPDGNTGVLEISKVSNYGGSAKFTAYSANSPIVYHSSFTYINSSVSWSGWKKVMNDVSLATVATSGSYNDLSNKPTIGNGTITIQKNGTTVDSFTLNQSSGKSINITVPTSLSQLSEDSTHKTVTDTEKTEWNKKKYLHSVNISPKNTTTNRFSGRLFFITNDVTQLTTLYSLSSLTLLWYYGNVGRSEGASYPLYAISKTSGSITVYYYATVPTSSSNSITIDISSGNTDEDNYRVTDTVIAFGG